MLGELPPPAGERIVRKPVLELTEAHARAARNLDAWHRDQEDARHAGFWLGARVAAVASTFLWAGIILLLHLCGVI